MLMWKLKITRQPICWADNAKTFSAEKVLALRLFYLIQQAADGRL